MRLIDADKLIKQCKVRSGALTEEIYSAIARHDYVDVHEFSSRGAEVDSLIRVIKRMPSAERRGKWIDAPVYKQMMDGKTMDGYTYCSECREMHKYGYRSNFCPDCGAKMEGAERQRAAGENATGSKREET